MAPIYLDNHATTPCDPRVVEAILPYFTEKFGNAASRTHVFGWEAEEAVERAREKVAAVIGAQSREIVFTSGATESNNLAIKGVMAANNDRGHIVVASSEHSSVLECCKKLARRGIEVSFIQVDQAGLVDLQQLNDSIKENTVLISIMAANNEIGTIAPLTEIGNIARKHNVLFHTDAAQAFGKVPIDVEEMNISLLAFTGHKIYGPKGVGGLYVRSRDPRTRLHALIDGGGHEKGWRSGTLNVAGIVGLGTAGAIYLDEREAEAEYLSGLRERFLGELQNNLDDIFVNGHPTRRLPGNLNVCFPGIESQALLMALGDEIAFSTGSACASSRPQSSHVLKAIGLRDNFVRSSVRFGFGRFNTEKEVDYVAERVIQEVSRQKKRASHFYSHLEKQENHEHVSRQEVIQ